MTRASATTLMATSLLVVVGAFPARAAHQPVPKSAIQSPPLELRSIRKPRLVEWKAHAPQLGVIEHLTRVKLIQVHWGSAPDSQQPGKILFRKEQEFQTGMYPTDMALIDGDTLVVAGKRKGDFTAIERWEFEWPDPLPWPSYDVTTGEWSYDIALPTLTSKTEIYGEGTLGRVFVRHLLPVRGLSGGDASVYVQFHDSGDIYSLNVTNEALVLITGPSKPGLLPAIPELTNNYKLSWAANHSSQGYVYVLGYTDRVEPTDPPTLVLRDTDRDGDIDNHVLVPADGWTESVYGDSANYIY